MTKENEMKNLFAKFINSLKKDEIPPSHNWLYPRHPGWGGDPFQAHRVCGGCGENQIMHQEAARGNVWTKTKPWINREENGYHSPSVHD